MMKVKTDRMMERTTGIAVLLFSLLFFTFRYPYHLFFTEQMQLFLLTPSYFAAYLSKPVALASYLGDFFTQFYYLRGGGALVITIHLLILWLLLRSMIRRFSGTQTAPLTALIPVVTVLALHTRLSYSLSFTVAVILSIAALLLLLSIRRNALRLTAGFLLVPILYWAAGSPMLLFALLFAVYEAKHATGTLPGRIAGFLVVPVALLQPLLLRGYYLLTWEQAWLTPAVHPSDSQTWLLLIPLTIVTVILLPRPVQRRIPAWEPILEITVITVFGTWSISRLAEFDLEKLLAVDSEIYFNHEDKAQEILKKYQLKSSAGAYFHNLLASKSDCLPEQLMNAGQTGPQGLFLPVDPQQNYVSITFANEVYYYLGDVNASQHLALLGMIFSPRSESSRLMRRLVRVNIINAEYAVAEKYIGMLEKSLFHEQWGTSMRQYLNNEDHCLATPWIMKKRRLRPLSEDLKSINDVEKTLQLLLERDPQNKAAFDYLNCWYLLGKDVDKFSRLCLSQPEIGLKQLPELYQQALLICYMQNPRAGIREKVTFNPEVVARFRQYNDEFEKNQGKGHALQKVFGNTYWFYYHYANLKGN